MKFGGFVLASLLIGILFSGIILFIGGVGNEYSASPPDLEKYEVLSSAMNDAEDLRTTLKTEPLSTNIFTEIIDGGKILVKTITMSFSNLQIFSNFISDMSGDINFPPVWMSDGVIALFTMIIVLVLVGLALKQEVL